MVDGVDDYAVALAIAVARRTLDRWVPVLAEDADALPHAAGTDLHGEVAAGRLFPAEAWRTYQQLWYRWRAPHDMVSPMQWYFAALAGRVHASAEEISETADGWLQEHEAMAPEMRADHVRAVLGVGSEAPLLAGFGDLPAALRALATAATQERPFAWLNDAREVEEAIRADARTRSPADPTGASKRLAARMRDAWCALPESERAAILLHLRDRYATLGPVRVDVVGRPVDNERGVALAEECMARPPRDWTYVQLVFASALWLWDLGDIGFTELNQADVMLTVLDGFLRAKRSRYLELLGRDDDRPPEDLLEVARSVKALRSEVERDHVRCFTIDGGSWERREHFLPLASVAADDIPDAYATHVRRVLGVELPEGADHRERFAALVDRLIARGTNPAEALVATAQHVLNDPRLQPHYVVVTATRGVRLDEPWTLDLADVFSYVAVRDDFDPSSRAVRLDDHQIRNAIAQRMRYNATCRGRNYSPYRDDRLKAQPFQFPDIAIMEDAHHTGHRAAGIRSVARSPFQLRVPGGQTWRGLADLRINRVSYRDQDRYSLADLPLVVRYSLWCKAIVEASYARGQLLDERYCAKQPAAPANPPHLINA